MTDTQQLPPTTDTPPTRTENNIQRRRRNGKYIAIIGGAILLGWMIWLTIRHSNDTTAKDVSHSRETKAVASLSVAGSQANQGVALAKTAQQQCKTDAAFRIDNPTLCAQASVLATAPVPGPPGPGGPPGRGIKAVNPIGGHLVIVYTDGTAQDVGQWVGPTGKTGPAGRGIRQQSVVGGHLIVSYTDGAVVDLGQVVGAAGSTGPTGASGASGPNGISVASVDEDASNHLIVTYSDGRKQDVGALPIGPPGPPGVQGSQGEPGASGAPGSSGQPGFPAGAIVIQVPNGMLGTVTETCTPQGDAGPGAQPTYACQ